MGGGYSVFVPMDGDVSKVVTSKAKKKYKEIIRKLPEFEKGEISRRIFLIDKYKIRVHYNTRWDVLPGIMDVRAITAVNR